MRYFGVIFHCNGPNKRKSCFFIQELCASSLKPFLKPLKVLANVWKPTLKKNVIKLFWNIQVFGNILMVIAVSLPFLYLKIFGETPKTGFYCDDESIGYPYKASTVPLWALLLGLSVPLITIILVEIVFLPLLHRKSI